MKLQLVGLPGKFPKIFCCFALSFVMGTTQAQPRISSMNVNDVVQKEMTKPVTQGTVVLPPDFDQTKAIPVVFVLPAIGATAANLLDTYDSELSGGSGFGSPETELANLINGVFETGKHEGMSFILVLTSGTGSSSNFATAQAWTKTIDNYEKQVFGDLAVLVKAYKIDTTRVTVAGFSFGADLAWALALKNPSKFQSAIIMSSRASYRPTVSTLKSMAAIKPRYFLTIGTAEDSSRIAGARAAAQWLKSSSLRYQFCEIIGATHHPAPAQLFGKALDFVLAKSSTGTTATKPADTRCR